MKYFILILLFYFIPVENSREVLLKIKAHVSWVNHGSQNLDDLWTLITLSSELFKKSKNNTGVGSNPTADTMLSLQKTFTLRRLSVWTLLLLALSIVIHMKPVYPL